MAIKDNITGITSFGTVDWIFMILLAAFVAIIIPILAVCIGAFMGFIVTFSPFGSMLIDAFAQLGVYDINLVNFGALMGFIGMFFMHLPNKD